MSAQLAIIGTAFMSAMVFAITFALAGGGAVLLLGFLAPAPPPEQEFITNLVIGIFFLYAAWIAGLAGGHRRSLWACATARA